MGRLALQHGQELCRSHDRQAIAQVEQVRIARHERVDCGGAGEVHQVLVIGIGTVPMTRVRDADGPKARYRG